MQNIVTILDLRSKFVKFFSFYAKKIVKMLVLRSKFWFIEVKILTYDDAGQIFQFLCKTNCQNVGFKVTVLV